VVNGQKEETKTKKAKTEENGTEKVHVTADKNGVTNGKIKKKKINLNKSEKKKSRVIRDKKKFFKKKTSNKK
jgi:hypothetical protein